MRFGAHVSIGKGFKGAIDQAVILGCDGFQIFAGNPRGWARKPIVEEEFNSFKTYRREHKQLWPVVVHLAYLPNPASCDDDLYEKSILTLYEDFSRANALGADFFVFHPGKSKEREAGIARIIKAIDLTLEKIKGPTQLLFENQAGGGSELAGNFKDLGLMIKEIKQKERVGVCFDTCHAFAAGYDIRNTAGWQKTLNDFEGTIGLSFLKMFHLNDSVGDLGSHLDRHQHIGEGTIGLEGFRYLVNDPVLNQLPGILETPQNSPEDDLKNLAVLRELQK